MGVVSEVEEVLVELSVACSSCSSGWLGVPGEGKVKDSSLTLDTGEEEHEGEEGNPFFYQFSIILS